MSLTLSEPHQTRYRVLQDLEPEELMELVQQDDEDAYSVLVDRFYRPIQHYLYRFVKNREVSEDLTQETFLRVYKSRHSYRRIAKFTTWLYTIAGNLARSDYRRRKRAQLVSLQVRSEGHAYEMDIPGDEPDPDVRASGSVTLELIQNALREVPDNFREVVVLRDMQDLSYNEIEAITGLPLGTVKSRIHRGRSMLQNLLSDVYPN